ncbi:hypothetical protein [Campylobacter troglodytis]|uniref:hypothetical protein n=1 Tax=Campylobacter troglodytis TaxID=654363 RepID=UPI001158301A|nr:hypothetical protein [Campylobacter troglodytis]
MTNNSSLRDLTKSRLGNLYNFKRNPNFVILIDSEVSTTHEVRNNALCRAERLGVFCVSKN